MSGKASTKTYLPRLLDAQLIAALDAVPAVHIAGAKATGKTETAKQLAASTLRLDEARTSPPFPSPYCWTSGSACPNCGTRSNAR